MADRTETIEVDGLELRISNGEKIFFPEIGATKRDLIDYYLAVADGALVGCFDRPCILKRFPNGAAADHFFQKRAPDKRPDFLRTATVRFPSGRTADFLVIDSTAALIWSINLGCIDINPWPVRSGEDVRIPGHPHQRPHRAGARVHRGPTGGTGPGSRRGAQDSGSGHQQVVEGGASRRIPRLQPERAGPHRGLGVLGATDSRCARLLPTQLG